MGHLHIGVQGVAMCRSSHQRAAYIATCRQRLNADEKQQHCYEEELLSHFPLPLPTKDVDACDKLQLCSNSPALSALILMVTSVALGPQNAGALAQAHCARILLLSYGLDGIVEFTEMVVPDTFPFTTTFSPANLSNCVVSRFKV
jgi:hypothetical protein